MEFLRFLDKNFFLHFFAKNRLICLINQINPVYELNNLPESINNNWLIGYYYHHLYIVHKNTARLNMIFQFFVYVVENLITMLLFVQFTTLLGLEYIRFYLQKK